MTVHAPGEETESQQVEAQNRVRAKRKQACLSFNCAHRTIDRYMILSTVWRHMYHIMMFQPVPEVLIVVLEVLTHMYIY